MIEYRWQQLYQLIITIWYPWLFFGAFMENLIPPIPSELIMPLGGILAASWQMTWRWARICSTVWSVLGTVPYYIIWRYLPESTISPFIKKYGKYILISKQDVDDGYELLRKQWKAVIFFGRFIPLWRWLLWLPAWSAGIGWFTYMIYSLGGTAIRAWFLTRLWYTIWDNFDQIKAIMARFEHAIIAIVVVWLIGWLIRRLKRKKVV